jgi:hypothetical protein
LKRDLGYGYDDDMSICGSSATSCGNREKKPIAASKSLRAPGKRPTHLILAVAVASRGSSCHLEGFRGGFLRLLRCDGERRQQVLYEVEDGRDLKST